MNLIDTSPERLASVVAAAAAAADTWSASDGATRAKLLSGLAAALEGARETLVPLADRETSLGPARLNGELDRTAFQLRAFAERAGDTYALVDDPAVAGAPPAGHPHLMRVRLPLGPVAMFAASNFPFAFSVLGGDTAAALAAGCTVVVKAHPGHPMLSRAVVEMAQGVVAAQGLPAGVFGAVEGAAAAVGVSLVQHPDIAAVAFTGSVRGGLALQAAAQQRARPIPFYGELGSVNPVVALPAAIAARGVELATTLAGSITLGCGQFCTSPGIVILFDAADAFVDTLAKALGAAQPHAMLTPGMRANFDAGVARLSSVAGVQTLLPSPAAGGATSAAPKPFLAQTDVRTFIANAALHDEVFGPACLLVRARNAEDAALALRAVGGSLTVTLWGAEDGSADARMLSRVAQQVAGRVLFAGVPTGVAVCAAQQHGGPFPSSTAPMTTSVGFAALDRFLRPVALQDAPQWLRERAGQPI